MTQSPLRVLVVDDEYAKRRLLARLTRAALGCTGADWVIEFAASAQVATAQIRGGGIDAVVTDWEMPHSGDGSDVVAAADELGIPCVVCSGAMPPARWTNGPGRLWPLDLDWAAGVRWAVEYAHAQCAGLDHDADSHGSNVLAGVAAASRRGVTRHG